MTLNDSDTFITLNNCDKLTDMDTIDITNLLILLNGIDIDYRPYLHLPENVTFGLEMETVGMRTGRLATMFKNKENWQVVYDKSLKATGAEVVSPILLDKPEIWREVFEVCDFLQNLHLKVNYETAGHIHLGATGIVDQDPEKLKKILKAWCAYENIIYRFSAGKWSHLRRGAIHKYAKPLAWDYIQLMKILDNGQGDYFDVVRAAHFRRFSGLNLQNLYDYYRASIDENYRRDFVTIRGDKLKDTLEIRTPNATIDPVIWQNNVNFFAKFFLAAANDKFDEDYLNNILKSLDFNFIVKYGNAINLTYENYEKIDFDKALELADIIFDNNLDKINFLKQYLGILTSNTLEKGKEKTLEKKLTF